MNKLQQGDVILTKLNKLPDGKIKIVSKKKCILAEGEHTGHAHIIEDDEAELIQIGEKMILQLEKQSTLTHQEHKSVVLDPGIYEIGRINEFDYLTQMVNKVTD